MTTPADTPKANDKPKPSLAERARQAVEAEFSRKNSPSTEAMAAKLLLTRRITRWVRRLLIATVVLFLVYAALRYQIYHLPKGYQSMLPAYAPDQRVVVDRFPSRFPSMIDGMHVGDVVVWVDLRNGVEYERLARIVAMPGARVEISATADGLYRYVIDGRILDAPFPPTDERGQPDTGLAGQVPAGSLMVLEDSVDVPTRDSRDFGYLPYANVRGRVVLSWASPARQTVPAPAGGPGENTAN